MTLNHIAFCLTIALSASASTIVFADTQHKNHSISEAIMTGETDINLNLRYERVNQDNALKDADALTLRTRLTYSTGTFLGFSSVVEFEDSRVVLGLDDYNNTLGDHSNHSVIPDPETTELDQFLIKYQQKSFGLKVGRQVITMDNHRFIGHVGWRQDRQTFDGVMVNYQASEKVDLNYGYLTQRNRIFSQGKDIDSKDHLVNGSYKMSIGKLTGYGYFLTVDDNTDNDLDTVGIRFSGATIFGEQKITYQLEYARQDTDNDVSSYSADYMLAEIGSAFAGVGFKLGYEILGSDNGNYGFSTPLATVHKFNGWSDQFLNTPKEGLKDLYASIGGKLAGGKWAVIYHKFDAENASLTVADLGSEINAVYSNNFTKNYSGGIKLAAYSPSDAGAGKVDTDKLWLWLNAKF